MSKNKIIAGKKVRSTCINWIATILYKTLSINILKQKGQFNTMKYMKGAKTG